MSADALNTTIRFIKGIADTEIDQTLSTGALFEDLVTGSTRIGSSRGATKVAEDHFVGLIYDFHIDHGFYAKEATALHYGNTG